MSVKFSLMRDHEMRRVWEGLKRSKVCAGPVGDNFPSIQDQSAHAFTKFRLKAVVFKFFFLFYGLAILLHGTVTYVPPRRIIINWGQRTIESTLGQFL